MGLKIDTKYGIVEISEIDNEDAEFMVEIESYSLDTTLWLKVEYAVELAKYILCQAKESYDFTDKSLNKKE